MYYTDDPVRDEMLRQRALDMALARRPKCHCCRKHIQDEEALHYCGGMEDIWLCLSCIDDQMQYIEVDL